MIRIAAIIFFLLSVFPLAAQVRDNITVEGHLNGNCGINSIFLDEFGDETDQRFNITISGSNTFSLNISYSGPRQCYFHRGKLNYDFLITPGERDYRFSITCPARDSFIVQAENLPEADAFNQVLNANRKLADDCAALTSAGNNAEKNRKKILELFKVQDEKLKQVEHDYPETYTAKILAPALLMPLRLPKDNALDSLAYYIIRKEAWNDTSLYHTHLPDSVFKFFEDLVPVFGDNGKDDMVKALLNAAPTGARTKVIYQFRLLRYFFHGADEKHLMDFCEYGEKHPDMIDNEVLKVQLRNMKKILPGSAYLNIVLNDNSGKSRPLSDVVGRYPFTAILFYSPNCEHCRAQMPGFVDFYNTYHQKGLEIFAVGTNCAEQRWQDYISENTGPWINVFEPPGQSESYMSDYIINNIPAMILLDKQGTIVSRFGDLNHIVELLNAAGVK